MEMLLTNYFFFVQLYRIVVGDCLDKTKLRHLYVGSESEAPSSGACDGAGVITAYAKAVICGPTVKYILRRIAEAPDIQRTLLAVHGKVGQVHVATCVYGQAL